MCFLFVGNGHSRSLHNGNTDIQTTPTKISKQNMSTTIVHNQTLPATAVATGTTGTKNSTIVVATGIFAAFATTGTTNLPLPVPWFPWSKRVANVLAVIMVVLWVRGCSVDNSTGATLPLMLLQVLRDKHARGTRSSRLLFS